MYFGAAYYPEHWPQERWATDAEMMERAGLNAVRMGEFGWSAIEPEEGRYEFGLFDRAIALLAEHGIKTMMCTCSRTPPPWV
ncbi:MAG: beta-galactosidase, partial [Planctomycetota bacterium]